MPFPPSRGLVETHAAHFSGLKKKPSALVLINFVLHLKELLYAANEGACGDKDLVLSKP